MNIAETIGNRITAVREARKQTVAHEHRKWIEQYRNPAWYVYEKLDDSSVYMMEKVAVVGTLAVGGVLWGLNSIINAAKTGNPLPAIAGAAAVLIGTKLARVAERARREGIAIERVINRPPFPPHKRDLVAA